MSKFTKALDEAKREASLFTLLRIPAEAAEAWAEELLTAWGINKENDYSFYWHADADEKRLRLRADTHYHGNFIEYYKLVKEIPKGERLCEHMHSPNTLAIHKGYETAGIIATVILKATIPDAVQTRLKLEGFIQETFSKGSVYETVVCPTKENTNETIATADIPF